MKKAIIEDYYAAIICEADAFFLKEDFNNLINNLIEHEELDYISPNNTTGWIYKPSKYIRLLNHNADRRNYFLPLGHPAPSTSFISLKTDSYKKFLNKYNDLFNSTEYPMAEETVTYQQLCQLSKTPINEAIEKETVINLDAFIRSNAWATFFYCKFKRGVAVNYDRKSFCRKGHRLYPDNLSKESFTSLTDDDPSPEVEGFKIVAPFFHASRGTMTMIYFAPDDPGQRKYDIFFEKFGKDEYMDSHISIIKLLMTYVNNKELKERFSLYLQRPNAKKVSSDYSNQVINFYKEAFVDYM
jgi:hypothetical protein